jgi:signal transduction histidine kinase
VVTRRTLVIDAAIAAAILAFSLGILGHGGTNADERGLDALAAALAALAALPLVVRRLAPLPVFALVTSATATLYAFDYGLGPPAGFALALYTVAERRDDARPRRWTVAVVLSVVVLLGPHLVRDGFAPELLLGSAVWAAAWFAGDRARLRSERLAELEERARRAEHEAEQERRVAVAEERARIARDLHDSAGHAINVILVQAGAARLLAEKNPQQARTAIETIEDVARDTVADIDRLVGALREDGAAGAVDVDPPIGLAALETLTSRERAGGLEIAVRVHGKERPISPAVDQAAYRILQEALTNAARHGAGSAEIEMAFGPRALELTITNPTNGETIDEGGHGIVGMRERAVLLGGRLEVAGENGVFRVEATLPYDSGTR